ncbi:MAG: DNA polymerase III subunit delta' [Pseudomonadota bacterium]
MSLFEEDISHESQDVGLLKPRQSNFFVGHQDVEETLLSLIEGNNLPHAVIFSGPKGIGKSTFAYRLARYLFAQNKDNNQDDMFGGKDTSTPTTLDINDPSIQALVSSGGHPDLMSVELPFDSKTQKFKSEIPIDSTRKIAPFLRMTSSEGGWRIVIIDDADKMNKNAQNSILKILEEPPKKTLLILVCHRLKSLLPTILSRSRVVQFSPLNDLQFNKLLEKEFGHEAFSPDEKEFLNLISENQFGIVKQFIELDALELFESIKTIFNSYPNWNDIQIHHFSESFVRMNAAKFETLEKILNKMLSDMILSKAKQQGLPKPFDIAPLQQMRDTTSLENLMQLNEDIHDLINSTKFSNLDKRLCVINIFSKFKQTFS